jgi:predicted AAA+ superfamily ATPase
MSRATVLLERLEGLLSRLELLLPPPPAEPDWQADAFRWRHGGEGGRLEAVHHPHRLELDDLLCMDRQKAEIVRNTAQFVSGRPANNVLLWGARGTGKSSLIKALLTSFRTRGLRLIEVERQDLMDLPWLVDLLRERPERFVVFCDDLSFEADDASYKALKAVLDGSLTAPPDNLLIYASSNRRHLMPEFHSENRDAQVVDGEIHQGEAVEEKISLSERFGLWLSFHPYNQAQYLTIVNHWLRRLDAPPRNREETERAALRWALHRGSRSGRVAWQFARDWAGRQETAQEPSSP